MCEIYNDIIYDPLFAQECQLDLYLPKGEKPCPVLIFFHGGGLEGGDRKSSPIEALQLLINDGIAVISADYRLYPTARYPDFLEDAAKVIHWAFSYMQKNRSFSSFYVGGSSAGAYIAMMMFFDSRYLGRHSISPHQITGYFFDAGQPTVHYNVLKERGEDSRLVRVDEAAPIFYIDSSLMQYCPQPAIMVMVADNDMPGRLEQTYLMLRAMKEFSYPSEKMTCHLMKGYEHTGYLAQKNENGQYIYYTLVKDFISKNS